MIQVIIFGVLDTAELAHFYLETDSIYNVVAFTVHRDFIKENTFRGLPVVPFEDVEKLYPPTEFKLFAPMTAKKMNKTRAYIYNEGKKKGYNYISYISSKATIFENSIGENCFILENNTIQPFTEIGNNVVLWSGNHIGHHSIIKDHNFFTSHVVISGHCTIKENCFFGVNSTVKDYITTSKGSLLGMSSSLTSNITEEWSVYVGNPAQKKGHRPSYDVY